MEQGKKRALISFIPRLVAAGLVAGFLLLLRMTPDTLHAAGSSGVVAAISLGGLIVMAWVMGDIFQWIRLPRITGYMFTGLLAGPHILRLISRESVATLKFIDNVALSLIALHAGHEVRLELIKRRFKSIVSITFFILLFSLSGVFLFVFFGGRIFFPFLKDAPGRTVLLVALLFGLIEVAKSPVTTIAILDETRARGRLAETTLGVVVLKDVILIVLFGVVMAIGVRLAHPGEVHKGLLGETLWRLSGSLGVGGLVGFLVGGALGIIRRKTYLLVIGLALGLTLLSMGMHLEVLLASMTAGFVIENFTRHGKRFLGGVEAASPLVYLIFFPVASAALNLSLLRDTWFIAVIIIMLRKVMVFVGINVGSRLVEDFPAMRRWGWMGFINQSGVTLALAIIIGREFQEFGQQFKAIALGMIVITDFYGPALFKYALYKAGDIGRKQLEGD